MGPTKASLLLQEKAPVWCILHVTPYATISTPFMHRIVDNYKNTLRVFGHLMLPRKHGPRTFHYRGDSGLVALVRNCTYLETLYIRERISTATLLIIAHEGKSLKELYVRKNGVILKSDWPKPIHWEEWRYIWLKKTARSYDKVEKAVSMMLKQKWNMLSDTMFKQLSVEL
jgi:F-box protein 39